MKKCTKCKSNKDESQFYICKARPDNRSCWCISCVRSKYREDNKERIKAKNRRIADNKEEARLGEIARIERRVKKAEATKERRKIRDAKRYQENRDYILAKGREYSQANKHKRRSRENQKRKVDPLFRLNKTIRARIHKALKNEIKDTSSAELLGCSTAHARQHLEAQFTKGMTWENHGVRGWHIDHIIPCDSFDLSDAGQQKQCFHYTNLQPLWCKDNLTKGDKLPDNHQPELAIPA